MASEAPSFTGNLQDPGNMECVHGYIPTVSQYMEGLGKYGTAITAVVRSSRWYLWCSTWSIFSSPIGTATRFSVGTSTGLLASIRWGPSCLFWLCWCLALMTFAPRQTCILLPGHQSLTDLTVTMFGCEKAMLAKLTETRFTLHVGLLRWCPFIPSPRVTKIRLRLVKWSLWQLPYTQCLFYFFQIYWTTAETDNYGRFSLNYAYLVLDVVDAVSFLMAMYAFAVLAKLVGDQLHNFNYKRKSATMLLVLVILKVPQLVIRILGNYDFFPLSPSLHQLHGLLPYCGESDPPGVGDHLWGSGILAVPHPGVPLPNL
ncbi:hypothetical protein Pcinc_040431 [Petrolisthes cinctipes]|uniref:Uncharacterized protein n=1 Tax=Petrolisthes cinctipes TaxID=88211 RepID=A0AAE1BMU1_PETCI|nr:hypothetical protein Pcinc_040431 [Petrolisthes cinctipes]